MVHVEGFGNGQTITGKRWRLPRHPARNRNKSEQGASEKVMGSPKKDVGGSNSLSRKG